MFFIGFLFYFQLHATAMELTLLSMQVTLLAIPIPNLIRTGRSSCTSAEF